MLSIGCQAPQAFHTDIKVGGLAESDLFFRKKMVESSFLSSRFTGMSIFNKYYLVADFNNPDIFTTTLVGTTGRGQQVAILVRAECVRCPWLLA